MTEIDEMKLARLIEPQELDVYPLHPLSPQLNPQNSFKFIKTLQRTLYGTVRLAVHLVTGTLVAIKLSRIDLASYRRSVDGDVVLENPLEEMRILRVLGLQSSFGSNRIVKLLGELQCKRYHWTIFEYAEGGELFSLISRGLIRERKARSLFAQIVHGVQFIHHSNFCHLDLSLENVLLDSNGGVKICDFGVAREWHEGKLFNTQELERCMAKRHQPHPSRLRPGKLNYMAPEVYARRPFCGKKADVFTLGVDLFLLLTGVLPFQAPTLADPCFEVVIQGNLSQLLSAWKMTELVPLLALDLMSHMLVCEPKRWSIEQVAEHAWVSQAN